MYRLVRPTGNGAACPLAHAGERLGAPRLSPQRRIGRRRVGERGRVPAIGPVRMRRGGHPAPGRANVVVGQLSVWNAGK